MLAEHPQLADTTKSHSLATGAIWSSCSVTSPHLSRDMPRILVGCQSWTFKSYDMIFSQTRVIEWVVVVTTQFWGEMDEEGRNRDGCFD